VYGPEHQRCSAALSGQGTSGYFAGNTWYLNGGGVSSTSYEKEVASRTLGTKHYVEGAAGVVLLSPAARATLNTLAPTTTSYMRTTTFGQRITTLTDASGAVPAIGL
jgi:hypothetical protein